MSGRKALPVYHYDTEENNFAYLGAFASRAEVFKMYYDGKNGKLFEEGYKYKKLVDGTYVTESRIGREGLRKEIRLTEDPVIMTRNDDKEIEIVNGAGEIVGTVNNIRILNALSNLTPNAIAGRLHKRSKPHRGTVSLRYKK